MITAYLNEIAQLSVAERIRLAQDIWDTVATHPDAVALSEAQTKELERRLTAYREYPRRGTLWQEVQQRVWGRK